MQLSQYFSYHQNKDDGKNALQNYQTLKKYMYFDYKPLILNAVLKF